MQVDVVVVGSGAAGLTAATVAAQAGLKVVLLEKTGQIGGTTSFSAGGLWIPNNRCQREMGIEDSNDAAQRYLRALLGNMYEADKVDAYLEKGPEMVAYMEANTEVKFTTAGSPDYESELDGASFGRTLLSPPFDARALGGDLRRMRPSLPQLSLFGTMQFGFSDVMHLLNVHRSLPSFLYSTKLVLGFVRDRVLHGRGARLANGNALVGRLLASAKRAGVTVWTNAPARELIVKDKAVRGVVTEKDGREVFINARHAVVLATGGFGANADRRAKHIPLADRGWSLQPEGNQGDGIDLGVAAGGVFRTDNIANGIWCPMSALEGRNGKRVVYPHLFFDRHCPGSIIVTTAGKRFLNESTHYQAFGDAMIADGIGSAWLIADHRAQRAYGMGLARPAPYPVWPFIRSGYLRSGRTLRELAGKIGVDGTTLEATVASFNANAAKGLDPEFGRGQNTYSRGMGDPTHTPNACLAPLVDSPFYAIEIRPGDLSSLCGLDTNANAQVLDGDHRPIDGLYAAGLDMNTMFRGTYPGGGASLGPAMTFGYVAARHIAERRDALPVEAA